VVDIAHHPDQRVAINNGTPNVLTVSGRLVREQPDLVARYLLQVLRAARWAHQHPTEAAPLVAQEVSVATEWVGAAFDDSLYEALFPSLAPPLVDALKVRKEFLLRHGFCAVTFQWMSGSILTLCKGHLNGWIHPPA
jgi:ABC-type nitrate/sulfonate/bicarbonate transport system substrate-binding protein